LRLPHHQQPAQLRCLQFVCRHAQLDGTPC
jgi:hypothetical protein